MNRRKRQKIEYRHYEIPLNSYVVTHTDSEWPRGTSQSESYLHCHNHLEIGFCYYGMGELLLDDVSYRFTESVLTVVPPNCPHMIRTEENTDSQWDYIYIDADNFLKDEFGVNVHMTFDFLNRIYSRPLYVEEREHPVFAQNVRSLLEEMRCQDEYYKQSIKGLLLQILIEVARMNESAQEGLLPFYHRNHILEKAMQYIEKNYARPIRIEEIAAECGISETHFRRVFGEALHMTPVEYINRVRIRAACEMLRKTEDPIMYIAKQVGFTTLSTFNRNFKRMLGVSPFDWRHRGMLQ